MKRKGFLKSVAVIFCLALLPNNAVFSRSISLENSPLLACYRFLVKLLPPPLKSRTRYLVKTHAHRFLGRAVTHGNVWKPDLKKFLPKAPIIIEAGAHIGTDTGEMKYIWPNSRIFAFEPIPDVFHFLTENTTHLSGVERIPLALGTHNSKISMHVSSGTSDGSSSVLKPLDHLSLFPSVKFQTQIEVQMVNLESWAAERGIHEVDLLWLDLQGYEFEAMKNSTQLLRRTRLIHTEVNTTATYEGAMLYPELRAWLERLGFVVETEFRFEGGQGNVLFRNTCFF